MLNKNTKTIETCKADFLWVLRVIRPHGPLHPLLFLFLLKKDHLALRVTHSLASLHPILFPILFFFWTTVSGGHPVKDPAEGCMPWRMVSGGHPVKGPAEGCMFWTTVSGDRPVKDPAEGCIPWRAVAVVVQPLPRLLANTVRLRFIPKTDCRAVFTF